MYKYFCNNCGHRFESEDPEYVSGGVFHGMIKNDITCPKCGAWEIYPDTPEGAAQSVKDTTAYENELMLWDEES